MFTYCTAWEEQTRLFCKGHDCEGYSAILWLVAGEEDVSSGDIALQLPPMAGQARGGEQPSCAKHSWEGREQGTSKEVEMW